MSNKDKSNSFDQLLGSVKPMKTDKIAPYRQKLDPIPHQSIADEHRVMDELLASSDEETSYASGDELKYIKDGYSPRLIKRLRRGDFAIEADLDLHGMFADEAKHNVHGFINECAREGIGTVRIVRSTGAVYVLVKTN